MYAFMKQLALGLLNSDLSFWNIVTGDDKGQPRCGARMARLREGAQEGAFGKLNTVQRLTT